MCDLIVVGLTNRRSAISAFVSPSTLSSRASSPSEAVATSSIPPSGIVVGTGLGLALASWLRDNGVSDLAVPVGSLIAFLVLSAGLGLIAATWRARRRANLDVLAAIASE